MSSLTDLLAILTVRRRITAEDVLALRAVVFGDNRVTPDEADALFALDAGAPDRAPEWDDFFVEALTDYVVRQTEPSGYVDEAMAQWLMARIGRGERVRGDSELELLVHILETAEQTPPALSAFALNTVKAAVLKGGETLRSGGKLTRGVIGRPAVELLRRILYAVGGDGNAAITRAEADILFDLNDATRDAANDPAWTDLFAKALAACVMTVSGYEPVSRDVAMREQAWLTAKPEGVGDFLGRMFGGGWASKVRYDPLAEVSAYNTAEDRALAAAEKITGEEASWLMRRIGRGGVYDAAELALIDFLRREAPQIDPALRPLLVSAPRPGSGAQAAPVFGHRKTLRA
jgi:hypothetical protein